MKTLYLAGPMTGIPFFNFPAFFRTAKKLEADGFYVLNPAQNDVDNLGINPNDFPTGRLADGGWSPDRIAYHTRKVVEWDVAALCRSDLMALLPGWENSTGVAMELAVAKMLNLEVIQL